MRNRHQQIGFSQRIRLEWLEMTSNMLLAGNDDAAIYNYLQALLKNKLSVEGKAKRGNREKAISILMKIWARPPKSLKTLNEKGLELLSKLQQEDHIAIHWGMTMAVYPFWGQIATQVGRLLRLQGTCAAAHIQRRIREQYGERETVSRATRRVLRSYVDWGVLRDTEKKGVYTSGKTFEIVNADLISWLIEAFLHFHPDGSKSIDQIVNSVCFFPFKMPPIPSSILVKSSSALDVLRYGFDQELVILKNKCR